MKKKLLIIIICLFSISNTFGQIDDIRKQADRKKENANNNNNSSNDRNQSNGGDGSPCIDLCFETCTNAVIATMVEAMLEKHVDIMNNRTTYPAALSLEIMPHAAYGVYFADASNNTYVNFLPRIRGNWGIFSTDLRLNYLATYKDYKADVFKTLEWNILMLNIMPDDNFKLSFGGGLLYEYYTKSSYNELFVGADFNLNNRKHIISLEGRLATNYEFTVFVETTLRANTRFINMGSLKGYVSYGIVYQNYYEAVDLLMGQVGLTFQIY